MSREERRSRVLVVDDKLAMAEMVADGLTASGYAAEALEGGRAAVARIEAGEYDAIVTDLRMPDVDGFAVLAASRATRPSAPVLIMTAHGAVDTAVEAIRRGAYHYLTKPFAAAELGIFLGRALRERELREETAALKHALSRSGAHPRILGESPAMRAVIDVVRRVADADTPVLLLGETGTGKSLLAQTMHDEGRRAAKPFVTVNCAALPEALLESELFGHVKGAFTGAARARDGLFVEAEGGTLLLDEIGDMALPLQAKLLHVLERHAVRPVGGAKERAIDVRVIAATHRDLHERVAEGLFREDLLYRLDVVSVEAPPLRQRRVDLPALVEHYLARFRERHPHSVAERVGAEAMTILLSYSWPGNVRELAHVLERAVLLAHAAVLQPSDLPPALVAAAEGRHPGLALAGPNDEVLPLRRMSKRYAAWAFERLGGHRARTAAALDVDPKTLTKLLETVEESD